MTPQNWFERVAAGLAVLSIGLVVSGTRACQEDYAVAPQADLNETPTPVVTDDGTDDDDDDLITPNPNGSPTPTATVSSSPSPTEAPTPTTPPLGAALGSDSTGSGVLQELQKLSEVDENSPSITEGVANARSAKSGNWLGSNFGKGNEDPCLDTDGDGFTDQYEEKAATDSNDPGSTPPAPEKNLMARLRGIDSDADGLADSEDPDSKNPDSDGDGRLDGAEVLSGGNVTDPNDTYVDADGDGLSDSFEENRGTDSNNKDTDGDGLSDAEEFVYGTNPTVCDTDGDGILDGAEVHTFQSDPTRGAPKKKLG